ncbi:MAG: twin-arginine translocase TatA/TatE family subunit [Candidatus Jidaibacter sp.]|jgi:sec-independent protein translocase protein TatA|nr:twin-arginine translocase TatA/TatE family subunit [Candidatus Jidaibacter sp.]
MAIGIWQLVLVLVIVFIVFGAGKLPKVMGEIGSAIKALREGLKQDER